jgi:hypothetical protein
MLYELERQADLRAEADLRRHVKDLVAARPDRRLRLRNVMGDLLITWGKALKGAPDHLKEPVIRTPAQLEEVW